jgi:MurNAc alpha-1-phosphate uridylyltransferase
MIINKAMILAAGRGERMRPLTDICPKPLISVDGAPMIDHILDHLEEIGVKDVVVNTSYLGDMLHEHLEGRSSPTIHFSDEERPLETGGGVFKALPAFGQDPFFVINGDVVWSDQKNNCLKELSTAWKKGMKALLLMVPTERAQGYQGDGDYDITDAVGTLKRRESGQKARYVFSGIQILDPSVFNDLKPGCFSLKAVYDLLEEKKELYGLEHKGLWFHVGTPEHLSSTREWFEHHKNQHKEKSA